MRNLLLVVFVGSFLALSTLGIYGFAIYHEQAHAVVLKRAGYKNVTIHFTANGMKTTGIGNYNTTDVNFSNKYNTLIEIIGYHMMGFTLNLWLIMLFLVAFLLMKEK